MSLAMRVPMSLQAQSCQVPEWPFWLALENCWSSSNTSNWEYVGVFPEHNTQTLIFLPSQSRWSTEKDSNRVRVWNMPHSLKASELLIIQPRSSLVFVGANQDQRPKKMSATFFSNLLIHLPGRPFHLFSLSLSLSLSITSVTSQTLVPVNCRSAKGDTVIYSDRQSQDRTGQDRQTGRQSN